MNSLIDYYQEKIAINREKISIQSQKNIFWEVLRIVFFICIFVILYFSFKNQAWINWVGTGVSILIFIIALKQSVRTNKKQMEYQAFKKVYEKELDSIVHSKYPNKNGSEFQDLEHPFINDLDIFGERTLFHLLNRCHTSSGYQYLAEQLKHPLKSVISIYQRQKAIQELKENKDFIFHLQASLLIKQQQLQTISNSNIHLWLNQTDCLKISKFFLWIIYIVPILNLMLLILTFIRIDFCVFLVFVVLLQGIFLNHYSKPIQLMKKDLDIIICEVENFNLYTESFKKIDFRYSWLQHIQQRIISYDQSTRQLLNLLSMFDMGNSTLGAFGNLFFLNHIKTAVKLGKWKTKNKETFPNLVENICEWETLVSLTIFTINHPKFVFPEIKNTSFSTILSAQDIGHPLISEEKNVTNEITIHKNRIFIITGANMAGKSTFLRTVGVNMLLAQIGAPVYATSFQCIPISLFTNMRTIDNLGKGISYFYAEVLRIKQLLISIASQKPFLLLIDELFSGTNSEDRHKSSLSFIRKLTRYSEVSALIATHDLGVTLLENENSDIVSNYYFECQQQEKQLLFDYKLKRGIARSYNAYSLLQQMQIVDFDVE